MGLWTDQLLPRATDRALRSPEVDAWRARACAGLHGRVLEIGFGSGLNIAHLPSEVESVTAVEPSDVAWRISQRRRERSPAHFERGALDGQRLGADDASYDAVLSTLTLCTIPDAALALAEVRRVLRPGGRFHFLEHGLAPDPGVVRWQRRLEPLQRRVAGGCHLTRDIPALVMASGLRLEESEQFYLVGSRLSRPWAYGYLGRAVA